AHPHAGHHRECVGHRFDDPGVAGGIRVGLGQRRDMGVRRALEALGENTSTKLMPRLCQSTVRMLPIEALISRPSTLTTISSPSLSRSPSAIFFSIETSGGPSYAAPHHSPSTILEPFGISPV